MSDHEGGGGSGRVQSSEHRASEIRATELREHQMHASSIAATHLPEMPHHGGSGPASHPGPPIFSEMGTGMGMDGKLFELTAGLDNSITGQESLLKANISDHVAGVIEGSSGTKNLFAGTEIGTPPQAMPAPVDLSAIQSTTGHDFGHVGGK